ncbi:MAG: class I SAM-dependent methyltransferase [Sciscionella sp.]
MHAEALEWVRRYATTGPVTVLDIGGRDINGTAHALFPGAATYTVLDIVAAPGVDVVADAATWTPDREYDVVVCTEVFEHTPHWRAILATARRACTWGGRIIATMAGPGRPEHSGIDGGWTLHPGEHYANIAPGDLAAALYEAGWCDVVIDQQHSPADVRCVARAPGWFDYARRGAAAGGGQG